LSALRYRWQRNSTEDNEMQFQNAHFAPMVLGFVGVLAFCVQASGCYNSGKPFQAAKAFWSKLLSGRPVVAFCLIGLLTTLNVVLHFPEWGAVIAQYNQY
jgi:hypothetical protein